MSQHIPISSIQCSIIILKGVLDRSNILQFSRGGKEINNGMAHLELDYMVFFFKKIDF